VIISKQQRARRLSADTAEDRCQIVRQAKSTIRGYQNALRLFCDYLTSPHYQWAEECFLLFPGCESLGVGRNAAQ
jgi:hypothetical protein